MPLLKLWNSLLGRSTASKETTPPAVVATTEIAPTSETSRTAAPQLSVVTESQAIEKRKPRTSKKTGATSKVRLATLETPVVATPAPAPKPVREPKVVTRGEHAALCKLVIQSGATSVLEIGVGDGSRAEAVMQSLQAVSGDKPLRYSAIDQFEMAGGQLTLKDFHLKLRAIEVRPQVFPQPLLDGLARFSRTIGFADLIISTASDSEWNRPEVQALVTRVTHASSVVLCVRDGIAVNRSTHRKAA